MASTSPTIDKARALLRGRRDEIQSELSQIDQALSSLGETSPTKRGPGRPRKSASTKGPDSKRRRSRRGGTRSEHAFNLITENPGMTAAEIAKALGIKPNYVYRVMGELVDDGRASKRGKGFFPAASTATAAEAGDVPDDSGDAPATRWVRSDEPA